MSLLDQAAARTDNADLVILALVESIRGRELKAIPSAVAKQIKGAPPAQVSLRMERLAHWGLLERPEGTSYAVSLMGAELLQRGGWTPDKREARRRDAVALSATTGAVAPRG